MSAVKPRTRLHYAGKATYRLLTRMQPQHADNHHHARAA